MPRCPSQTLSRIVIMLLIAFPCVLSGCKFRGRATVNTQSASLANNVKGGPVGLATMGLNMQIYVARQRQHAMQSSLARARNAAAAMRREAAAAAESAAERARQAAREEMNRKGATDDGPCDPSQSPS
ncbi:MAG: hypothetical protein AB1696_04890 [Planctomycetota bacterium]